MQLHEMLSDGKTDTETSLHFPARVLRLTKAIEHVREEVGRDTRARVRHPDLHLGIRPAQGDLHSSALAGELDRIRDEIPDDWLEPIGPAPASSTIWKWIPLAVAAGLNASAAASTTEAMFSERASMRNFPDTTRDRSSSSSTSRAWREAFRLITSAACRTLSGLNASDSRIRAQPRTALSGVRSSWESVTRN
jgi:hypothetical protein